jgi:hypothetical protein
VGGTHAGIGGPATLSGAAHGPPGGRCDLRLVTENYKAYENKFTGKILKVTVDVKEMGAGEKAAAGKASADAARKIE